MGLFLTFGSLIYFYCLHKNDTLSIFSLILANLNVGVE